MKHRFVSALLLVSSILAVLTAATGGAAAMAPSEFDIAVPTSCAAGFEDVGVGGSVQAGRPCDPADRAFDHDASDLGLCLHPSEDVDDGRICANVGVEVRDARFNEIRLRPAHELVAPRTTRFGPANPGPLDDSVAATFRSASYDEVVLSQDTMLYRVYGGEAGPIGGYWSRTPPSGPMQAQIDLALNPQWGNLATDVATIRVPAGTTIYEGAAAAQSLPGGGTLLGGENQVFIPNVNSGWLVGG